MARISRTARTLDGKLGGRATLKWSEQKHEVSADARSHVELAFFFDAGDVPT